MNGEHGGALQLPIIDISPYVLTDESQEGRQHTAEALDKACTDVGFFYLTGHGIPSSTTDRVIDLAREFFLNSPEEEKTSIQRADAGIDSGDSARGYQKIGENVTKGRRDWHEAIDFYAESQSGDAPPFEVLHGRNLWPRNPSELQGAFEAYLEQLKQVGAAVVRAMGDALHLKDPELFVKATNDSFWVLRMIGYPGLPAVSSSSTVNGDAEQFSCGEHTDYGCVTLLLADSTPDALQVQSKNGDWITANPVPGAFVVNIGDMIQRWTNGLWKSTNHRVIHKSERYRVSVPFFFEPNWDAVIEPLDECVKRTNGGKRLYEQLVYGPYLKKKVEGNFY